MVYDIHYLCMFGMFEVDKHHIEVIDVDLGRFHDWMGRSLNWPPRAQRMHVPCDYPFASDRGEEKGFKMLVCFCMCIYILPAASNVKEILYLLHFDPQIRKWGAESGTYEA